MSEPASQLVCALCAAIVDPALPTCFCCCCILPAFGKPCFLITWFFALVECIYNGFPALVCGWKLETVSGISGFMLDF